MNFRPLIGFYWKHGTQIEEMVAGGGTPGESSLILALAEANVPVIKRRWPALNANGLLDDALQTLRDMLAPDVAEIPDRNSQGVG